MASRSTNTMAEALQKLMRDIADMKTLADADLPWLIQLENMVISRLQQPVEQMLNGNPAPAGPPPGMGSGGGGMPAGAMQGGGLMAGPSAPNPDELSRLLSGAQG